MIHKYLQDPEYYEDSYDRITVDAGRRHQVSFEKIYNDLFEKFNDEDPKSPRSVLHFNILYMAIVGSELLDRYDQREERIREMMAEDEAKDARLRNARLQTEPLCQHCGNKGLRIIYKSFMHRGSSRKYTDREEVLFMLECIHCEKRSAYWEDGSTWEHLAVSCPKCSADMVEKGSHGEKVVTTTYTCPDCGHSYKDKLDLRPKKQKSDPEYESDQILFCLQDEKIRTEMRDSRRRFEEMARLGKEMKEREENKHVYDAIASIKKPKIAELVTILAPVFKKAGYIELSLDKPELGRDVVVGFNCLDSKPSRDDYESRKTLRTTVDKVLQNTNWRLMSDGISYRLGYLSGRLKAYEGENALKSLVTKGDKQYNKIVKEAE